MKPRKEDLVNIVPNTPSEFLSCSKQSKVIIFIAFKSKSDFAATIFQKGAYIYKNFKAISRISNKTSKSILLNNQRSIHRCEVLQIVRFIFFL
jgi:hypothetical protein